MSSYLAKPQRFLVRPAPGWVDLTLQDVSAVLDAPTQKYKFKPAAVIEDGIVVVSDCDYRQALELVARLTTAHDVEWVIHSGRVSSRGDWKGFFEASGVGELFKGGVAADTKVSALVSHPVVGTAKDIREIAVATWGFGAGENENEEAAESKSHRVRIDSGKNRTRILVSLAGEPLYKRGYKARVGGATAPLPEHHASACFLWSAKQIGGDLKNKIACGEVTVAAPFAGTGTTGFEAVCRVLNITPALTRDHYACEDFSFHPEATMSSIRKRLLAARGAGKPKIVFGDNTPEILDALSSQVTSFKESIGVDIDVRMTLNDFLASPDTLAATGFELFLPLNPPYGLRLAKQTGSVSIYERLGLALARLSKSNNISGYVICPDEDSWRALLTKLKSFTCHTCHFSHGGRDTRLVAFTSPSSRTPATYVKM